MSLINDMLRDLEARHSDDLKRQNVRTEVRPLPPPASPAWKKNGIGLLFLLLVIAGGALWGYERGVTSSSTQSVPPTSPAVPQEESQKLPSDDPAAKATVASVQTPGQAMPPAAVRLPAKTEPSPAIQRPRGEKPVPEGGVTVNPEKKRLVLDWAGSKKSEAIQSSPPEGEGGNNASRRSFYRFFQKTTPSTDQGEREELSRRRVIGTPERFKKSGESRSPYRFFTGSSGDSDDSSQESPSLRRRSEVFPGRDSFDNGRPTNSERSFWSRTKERVVFPANSGEAPTFRRQESRSFQPLSSSGGNSVSSRSSERSQAPSRSIKKKD